jgi:hypothetical protein
VRFRSLSRKVAKTLVLVVSAVVLGVLLAELVLRIAGVTFPVFDTYDHHRAVALKPGKKGWYEKEGSAYLTINSLGYRDVEHIEAKPSGTFRIAVLGDSFSEARQVDISDTYWKLLEGIVSACPTLAGRKVEVLNFGVGGYSTTQSLLTLDLHALDFEPDLVLLGFLSGNDVAENSKRIAGDALGGWRDDFRPFSVFRDGHLVLDNAFRDLNLANLGRRFMFQFIHYSRVLELINQTRRVIAVRRLQSSSQKGTELEDTAAKPVSTGGDIGLYDRIYVPPDEEIWREAWAITEELLKKMDQTATQAGASFVVAVLTTPSQVHPDVLARSRLERQLGVDDLYYPDRRLRAVGERLGFPVITIAESLQAIATEEGVYLHGFPNTVMGRGHWNEMGHLRAAQLLANELCAKNLLR